MTCPCSLPARRCTSAARVVRDAAGGLALRLAHGREVTQRREAVRGDLELSLRVGVPGAPASVRGRVVRGRTVNVSAGGLLALLDVNPGCWTSARACPPR